MMSVTQLRAHPEHTRCALRWSFGCEAGLIPDFERIQGALKRPRDAASLKVVEGFTVHKIGFRNDNPCVTSVPGLLSLASCS